MNCGCENQPGGRNHRAIWVTAKVRELRGFHPLWLEEGTLYVAEAMYADAYGQSGDVMYEHDVPPPDEDGIGFYDEWLRKTHRDQ